MNHHHHAHWARKFDGSGWGRRPESEQRRHREENDSTELGAEAGQRRKGHGRGGGRRGFGPGGPGFGPGFGRGPGFGGPNPYGAEEFGPGRGRRRRRGDLRWAILSLLAERPRHGYALMSDLAERTGGMWRPSPGSVYPVLAQLEDEALIEVDPQAERREYRLTDAGRAEIAGHQQKVEQAFADAEPRAGVHDLWRSGATLAAAVRQVAMVGQPDQVARAAEILDRARRSIYGLLAEEADPTATEPPSSQSATNAKREQS